MNMATFTAKLVVEMFSGQKYPGKGNNKINLIYLVYTEDTICNELSSNDLIIIHI